MRGTRFAEKAPETIQPKGSCSAQSRGPGSYGTPALFADVTSAHLPRGRDHRARVAPNYAAINSHRVIQRVIDPLTTRRAPNGCSGGADRRDNASARFPSRRSPERL